MRDALISVNFICNLRCRMCSVWQNRENITIDPALYRRLPPSLRRITLTGGEIFLDNRLEERIRVISETCPRARLILITNGSMPDRIEHVIRSIRPHVPQLAVRVSLDGPKEIHDKIRGREGAHDSALQTLRMLRGTVGGVTTAALGERTALKERGARGALVNDIGISFTLQPENLGSAKYVMGIAKNLGVDFVCNVVQNSGLAYGTCQNVVSPEQIEPELLQVMNEQLRSRQWKQWFRAYFTEQLLRYHQTGRRSIPCQSGRTSFYLNHDGGVYACNILDDCLGNISETSINAIFAQPEVRNRIASLDQCQACWTSCNIAEALRAHPARILAWILQKKLHAKQ